jgi:hypothetical protein
MPTKLETLNLKLEENLKLQTPRLGEDKKRGSLWQQKLQTPNTKGNFELQASKLSRFRRTELLSRPFGTCSGLANRVPTLKLKRWAIIASPFGDTQFSIQSAKTTEANHEKY